jgi:hypothetical protein
VEVKMSLLDSILSAGNGAAVGQIASKLGIPEDAAKQAASALTPALARGLQRNTQQGGGLDSLLGALSSGSHQKYVDQPDTIGDDDGVADGNKILGHILGSKDVSRNVAGAAAAKTGIDSDTLKKMLPMLATVAMGALSKQTKGSGGGTGGGGGGLLSGLTGGAGSNPLNALQTMGGLGALTQFLDADKDGDATDDLLTMAKKYF